MKKGFNSDPLYNEKYLKTKTKSYSGKFDTKLHDERTLKEGLHCLVWNFDKYGCLNK